MTHGTTVMALACVIMLSCGFGLPDNSPGPRTEPAVQPVRETLAWSLSSVRKIGFVADSIVTSLIQKQDATVEIVDKVSMNLVAGGDFSFKRIRTHKGASDGASEEMLAAVRVAGDWFMSGSSGQWVRWDDALTQPDAMIDDFIAGENQLLLVVSECGITGPADEDGRLPITGLADKCRYGSGSTGNAGGVWAGRVKALAGHITLNGDMLVGADVELDFVSGFDAVPASVKLKYALTVTSGGDRNGIRAPDEFLDSRRPRPVRMVDSVLSGLVDEWGDGAPGVLKESPSGKSGAN